MKWNLSALYRVAQSRGVLNHLLGRSLPSEQTGHDSVFLTSAGRLTSYSPDGEPNWQVNSFCETHICGNLCTIGDDIP